MAFTAFSAFQKVLEQREDRDFLGIVDMYGCFSIMTLMSEFAEPQPDDAPECLSEYT